MTVSSGLLINSCFCSLGHHFSWIEPECCWISRLATSFRLVQWGQTSMYFTFTSILRLQNSISAVWVTSFGQHPATTCHPTTARVSTFQGPICRDHIQSKRKKDICSRKIHQHSDSPRKNVKPAYIYNSLIMNRFRFDFHFDIPKSSKTFQNTPTCSKIYQNLWKETNIFPIVQSFNISQHSQHILQIQQHLPENPNNLLRNTSKASKYIPTSQNTYGVQMVSTYLPKISCCFQPPKPEWPGVLPLSAPSAWYLKLFVRNRIALQVGGGYSNAGV